MAEVRALDIAPLKAGPAQVRALEAPAVEPRAVEDRTFERGPGDVRVGEIRAREVAFPLRVSLQQLLNAFRRRVSGASVGHGSTLRLSLRWGQAVGLGS